MRPTHVTPLSDSSNRRRESQKRNHSNNLGPFGHKTDNTVATHAETNYRKTR